MNPTKSLIPIVLPLASALAQGPDPLVTFRFPETTMSLSGGTPLQTIWPNEIAQVRYAGQPPCPVFHTCEKWSPRTCFQAMAGDENGNGQYWNPSLFAQIDALCLPSSGMTIPRHNPRSVFWSPTAAMGTNVSAAPLRPGDVGRITFGQVEYFLRQEQVNKALGLQLTTAIDIDAIAYQVGLGVYLSLDNPVSATTACGFVTVNDGDVIAIPDSAITWSLDYRVADVLPNSAAVVLTELQINAMLANSGIADRFGSPLTLALDLEALDIDQSPQASVWMFQCGSYTVPVPQFLFATQSMTGASLLSTIGGGTIPFGPCSPLAMAAPNPSSGVPMGIQPVSSTVGAASYINALAFATTKRFVLEPQNHQLNYGGLGGPGTTVHIGSDFPLVFTWIEFVSPVLPAAITVAPFVSPDCFPDYYFPSNLFWNMQLTSGGIGTFATPAIPVGWSGKMLFQSAALDGPTFQLSTPAVIDVQ
ncbi:MAG: hypothetical protein WAT39_25180 [Planctomycetota bacterium]